MTAPGKETFGSRVKKARAELRLTQPELAEIVGCSNGTISFWENSVNGIRGDNLVKLAIALKKSTHYLLTGEEDPQVERLRVLFPGGEAHPKLLAVLEMLQGLDEEDYDVFVRLLLNFSVKGTK